jgi:hypothetical protein
MVRKYYRSLKERVKIIITWKKPDSRSRIILEIE